MKIAIEAQRIFRNKKHGMDIVALEIIRQIQKQDTENEYYILVAPGPDKCLKTSPNMHIMEIGHSIYPLWEQIELPYYLNRIKPDILHCTSNTAPLFLRMPLILTLHDIVFLEKTVANNKSIYQSFGRKYRRFIVPRILDKAKTIITVSDFERENIIHTRKIDGNNIITIHNGYNTQFTSIDKIDHVTKTYIDKENYLLYFGNTDPKKNTIRTLKAYSLYTTKSKNPLHLLVTDMEESTIDDILKGESIENIKPYLHCSGYISNSDLPYIYNGAFAFLYTSTRESFGLPILESMACGTPVIVSNTSAMPEIAGNGALFCDPYSEQDIANKILSLENDSNLYQQQVEYGKERVKLFSWEKAANKLLDIIHS